MCWSLHFFFFNFLQILAAGTGGNWQVEMAASEGIQTLSHWQRPLLQVSAYGLSLLAAKSWQLSGSLLVPRYAGSLLCSLVFYCLLIRCDSLLSCFLSLLSSFYTASLLSAFPSWELLSSFRQLVSDPTSARPTWGNLPELVVAPIRAA